jgi:ABC-type multidrug transport system fused ATPase/permease subunit
LTAAFSPPADKLKLRAYVFKYPRQFIIQALGGIIYDTLVIAGPVLLGKTIDAGHAVYIQGMEALPAFYKSLAFFILTAVMLQTARYFKRYYIRELNNLIKCDMRATLFSALLDSPASSRGSAGDAVSRLSGDVDQVGESARKTITEIWDTGLVMVSYFIACLYYSPKITLIAAVPIPFSVLAAELLRLKFYTVSLKTRKAAAAVSTHLQRTLSAIAELRLFGLEARDTESYSALLKNQLRLNVVSSALQNGMKPLYILASSLGLVAVVGMGGSLAVSGAWTIGEFTAYLSLFSALAARTNVAAKVMNTWHGARASWDRIREKLQPDENPGDFLSGHIVMRYNKLREGDFCLTVENLTFAYPGAANGAASPALRGISFFARSGEIIGITGPVGSGKSALAAALAGIYSKNRSGGDGGKQVPTAYMDSSHFVFSDDVAFNVTLCRNKQGGVTLDGALELAELAQDVGRFERGTNTRLMERGVRISGGQRQRIALARAWYADADLVLLDDPFSAIDARMEERIMRRLREKARGKIILIFSHRLSSFALTDKVIVLDKGTIVQEGTHEELLAADGVYKTIFYARENSPEAAA